MKVLFVANPCSGRGKLKNELLDILTLFSKKGYEVTTHITTKRGNATEVVRDAKEKGYELIVCCGGDGTLNEVITGMVRGECDIPLGYIPAGTTNDFARTLELETDMQEATRNIMRGKNFPVDIGKFLSNRYFTYIASFGLFTSVSYKTQQTAKNALGHMAYIFEGIANMANIEEYEISYEADGKKYEGVYVYGGITNSTSIAGMFKFDNDVVDLSDGLFEILMIKKPKTPNEFVKIISGITTGDLSDTSVFDFFKASKITFNMPEGVIWTLDGEPAKGRTKVVIENLPKKIEFVK